MNLLNTSGYEIYNKSITKGDGCYVFDSNNTRYIDFEAGVWALPLGHNNIEVNNALIKQLSEISHIGYRFSHAVVEEAAASLLRIMNLDQGKCLFLSSGSEAVEFAVKVIKAVTDKPYLLNLDKYYLSAYGATGNTSSDPWISLDWRACLQKGQSNYDEILKDIPFEQIGAFVFEAGNGSGNVWLPPKDLIQVITSRVKEYGGWIVVDEVTVGMGRTGKWFGFEHYGIHPDIIACGKGLGNGYPVSAVGVSRKICDLLEKSSFAYAQSHQNDPLGCAVAKEVIRVINEKGLLEQATRRGKYLLEKLSNLKNIHSCIKEVRGIGLLCAIEFKDSIDEETVSIIHRRLFDAGFVVGLKLATNVMRFYPPLIIEEDMIDAMIKALNDILEQLT
jgi:acetylornithine aminotransferase